MQLIISCLGNVGDLLYKRPPFFCNTKALAYPSEIAYLFWGNDVFSVSMNLENDRINDPAIYLKMRWEALLLIWQEIIMAKNGNFLH